MRIFIALTFILCVALIGCRKSEPRGVTSTPSLAQSDYEIRKWKVGELCQLITSARPWSSYQAYSKADWDKIIEVAKVFQVADTNEIVEAFGMFDAHNTNDFRGDYLESSKAFLLLRVIFNLPEHARGERAGGPGWLTLKRDLNPDGTVNLGWPIAWNGGSPSLVSEYIGYDGFPYSAKSDYIFLSSHFKHRDLKMKVPQSDANHHAANPPSLERVVMPAAKAKASCHAITPQLRVVDEQRIAP